MSKISWCDITVNPFPGCNKVSPGCQNCYAERMAQRLKAMGHPAYQRVVDEKGWTGETSCAGAILHLPRSPRRVFVNSMGDLFYDRNPWIGGLDVLFGSMLSWTNHTFQVLTKRPELALDYYRWDAAFWSERGEKTHFASAPNIWLGVTCENQEWADKRIPILLQIPAAVRFVSIEPCLSGINLRQWLGIHWVVCGPETGPGRRPCKLEWIEDIVHQCRAASVPVHVKAVPRPDGSIEHDIAKFPEHLRVREFPR